MTERVRRQRHMIAYGVMVILIALFAYRVFMPGAKSTTPDGSIIKIDPATGERSLNLPPLRYDSILFPPPEPAPPSVPDPTNDTSIPSAPLVAPPTTLGLYMEPNPVRMLLATHATVTGDGQGVGVTLSTVHAQSGEEVSHPGWLNPDGKFETTFTVNRPGRWTFIASASNVSSGEFHLVAQGIEVVLHDSIYDKSEGGTIPVTIFTHMTGDFGIWASSDNWVSELYITSSDVGEEGLSTIQSDLSMLTPGRWKIDARIGDHSANDYGGSAYVEVIE